MGKGSNTTSTSSTSSADPQAAALYRDILTRAQGVASTPYQAYSGELTAPTNAQQNLGVAGINANANYASPFIQQAAGQATASSAPLSASAIQQYLNPYTQSVVDATTQQMQHDNAQAMAGLQGNQIAQGALGGNATGVAKGILAGQQNRTDASTIANLYSQGYTQALGAAQNQQQLGLAGANAIANYGIQGQNAALTGANAQFGVGAQQQQTQQAQDNALYQQYLQAQAYPYQQTQWLAGLGTGVGSNLGGVSSGTTTGPAPNQTAQYLGLGLSAAGMFLSDREAKEDIEHIGHTNDGQKIYRYRYKGRPETHIGLIAQEVKEDHPEAVEKGLGGLHYVDLKGATDDAVSRAAGGGVGGTPFSEGLGWIPTMQIHGGSGAPSAHAPSLGNSGQPTQQDFSKVASGITGVGGKLQGLDWSGAQDAGFGNLSGDAWGGGSFLGGGSYGGSSAAPLAGLDASDYGIGFARGGGVAGYADGGSPEVWDENTFNPIDAAAPDDPFGQENRSIAHAKLREDDGVRSYGENTPVFGADGKMMGNMTSDRGVAPVAAPAAPAVAADDDEETPAVATPTAGRAPQGGVAAFQPQGQPGSYSALPDAITRPSGSQPGFGLGLLTRNQQTGLLAAGLGMLANRSPFLGVAVGEGGLAGLGAYGAAEQADQKAAMEADKLRREANQKNIDNMLKASSQAETARHNRATEEKEFKPQLIHHPDPATGQEVYGTFDPNTRTIKPLQFPSTGDQPAQKYVSQAAPVEERRRMPAASPEARDEGYLKYLEEHRPPGYADIVRGVADYEMDPNRVESLQKGQRSQLYRDAKLYDPTYDQTHFGEKVGVINSFSRGADRAAVNSLNVSVSHLDALRDLGAALKNGQFPIVNRIFNQAGIQLGGAAVTNFNAAKEIVGDEVVKAIVGGVSAQADRDAIKHLIMAQQSPEQLQGTINTFITLLGGQLEGRRTGYQAGTGLNNFDQKYLSPETREALTRTHGAGAGKIDPTIMRAVYPSGIPIPGGPATQPATGAPGTFQPPQGAIPRLYKGKTYYYDPVSRQPYPGQ